MKLEKIEINSGLENPSLNESALPSPDRFLRSFIMWAGAVLAPIGLQSLAQGQTGIEEHNSPKQRTGDIWEQMKEKRNGGADRVFSSEIQSGLTLAGNGQLHAQAEAESRTRSKAHFTSVNEQLKEHTYAVQNRVDAHLLEAQQLFQARLSESRSSLQSRMNVLRQEEGRQLTSGLAASDENDQYSRRASAAALSTNSAQPTAAIEADHNPEAASPDLSRAPASMAPVSGLSPSTERAGLKKGAILFGAIKEAASCYQGLEDQRSVAPWSEPVRRSCYEIDRFFNGKEFEARQIPFGGYQDSNGQTISLDEFYFRQRTNPEFVGPPALIKPKSYPVETERHEESIVIPVGK